MSEKILMSGNEALAEAAVRAACDCYFGYPITPQSQIAHHMSRRMKEEGRVFLQAESEIAAINMVYGAAATGARAMTSSSGPGISLKQEGISYLAAAELPAVIVNMMRGGPGLGNIAPAQGDYFQATRPGGHGDYRMIVLAPDSVQETADLTYLAFDLADKYRNPVMILGDAILAQMMEGMEFKEYRILKKKNKDWAVTGAKGRLPKFIRTSYPEKGSLEKHNKRLQEKYARMARAEVRYELIQAGNDIQVLLIAYGCSARIMRDVLQKLAEEKITVALLRPITLWPFPYEVIRQLSKQAKCAFVLELSEGQMLLDVQVAIERRIPVHFHGRLGGGVPSSLEVLEKVKERLENQDGTR